MKVTIPELSLVVLIGVSGAGKSTFGRKHFKATEVISSDVCRGLVSDDENSLTATPAAFEVLHFIARKRLEAGKLTVIDATNVQPEARKPLVELAREFHCLPVAIVLDVPTSVAQERNKQRPDRDFGPHVIRQQANQLHRTLRGLDREGFRRVHVLRSLEDIEAAEIVREPLWNNRKFDHGPFDFIGDVHGCGEELRELLTKLGYVEQPVSDDSNFDATPLVGVVPALLRYADSNRLEGSAEALEPPRQAGWRVEEKFKPQSSGIWTHPAGRKFVFVGDLVDRGPQVPQVMHIVMESVKAGSALCVTGNHDVKFMRKVFGKNVALTHGLAESVAQFEAYEVEHPGFTRAAAEFIDSLISHYVLDDGRVVVAHAGVKESMQGRASGGVREFCLYGETTGETDEFGLPVRMNWAAEYRGPAIVVYGHTPVPQPEWLNRTINIDTGCVFGGKLTALRYPEMELVSVPAKATYAESRRPFLPVEQTAPLDSQQQLDDLLDLADVTGKRVIGTRLHHNITIREENATAALEVMSRFAANPKWLIYLPPTMSPCATSAEEGLLEHPAEAFDYYLNAGVPRVMCEEKHMGSRAVVIVCRDEEAATRRFGVVDEGIGIVLTRTGRRFFNDQELEADFLSRVQVAITTAGWWEEFSTSWVCLDCELMPWSAKAQALLQDQYAPVGASAKAMLTDAVDLLQQTATRGQDVAELLARTTARQQMAADYVSAYRRYCWPVNSVDDFKLAPFHLLATERAVHVDKPHDWHMQVLARLAGGIVVATPHRVVDVTDPDDVKSAIDWWTELTSSGGEGMVIKPLDFITRGSRGILQPAVKCRGREYLRIIYGPDYTAPEHLHRLRSRGLKSKQSLALREFALGVESLERFVRREPLRRVHECVFGVLALESEPVDPRL